MNWFKKRKQAKAAKEALAIGTSAVNDANAAIDQWESTSLQTRRAMIADFFDERITDMNAGQGIPFDEWAEIEAVTCLKNWIEKKDDVVQEIAKFIDPEAWEILKVIGIEEELLTKLYERFDEVGHSLADDLDVAVKQESIRRG